MPPDPTRRVPAISAIASSRSSADPRAASAGSGFRLATTCGSFRRRDAAAVAWSVGEGRVDYEDAVRVMEQHVEAMSRGEAPERIWLVEHPALLTAGTAADVLPASTGLPLHRSGRGGRVTYHGPGQRVAYVMLDLKARRADLRAFVAALEQWIIDTLAAFAIQGERREDRVGVWVARNDKPAGSDGAPAEDKIAAIGIRVRRWISFHGISLNVEPDLAPYRGIAPCGITEPHLGVTSLADLGRVLTMAETDAALRSAFAPIFGPTEDA